MTAVTRVRNWLAAKRRFEFVATVAMVIALTAVGGALVLLPKSALQIRPVPATADAAVPSVPADPQLPELRRTMESYAPVITRQVCTDDGRLSVVLGHPSQRRDVDALAADVGAAVASVTKLWGTDWARHAVIAVASDPAEFAALTHDSGEVSDQVAAASVSDPFVPPEKPTGQRVVFSAAAGGRLGDVGLRETLRHELTHVAARAVTVDGSPQWVLEGFAEYSAHRGSERTFAQLAPTLTARARAGTLPADLPADDAFAPTPGNDAALAYEQGWSANAYVAERYGEPKLVDLYRHLATGPQDPAALDTVLRTTLGVGRADFVARWRDWIRSRATT
ncbi:hypothetical protein [Nocardia macrotermitis]|uniref:Peptidase MA superfamily protein n=1 Tax=Nocardia macrotermitis TaxID=2585198 RepID=A0A7K0D6E2_9NOCA|nr:hypothetical protein [Nocardia macrotermitis]MQY21325.1 hypothetical protein [Nocardia macrotermitis]